LDSSTNGWPNMLLFPLHITKYGPVEYSCVALLYSNILFIAFQQTFYVLVLLLETITDLMLHWLSKP